MTLDYTFNQFYYHYKFDKQRQRDKPMCTPFFLDKYLCCSLLKHIPLRIPLTFFFQNIILIDWQDFI